MIILMHAYAHTQGFGTLTVSQHNTFDSEKLSQIFIVFLTGTGFEHWVFGSPVERSTN